MLRSDGGEEVDAPPKGRIEIYARDLYGRAKSLLANDCCASQTYNLLKCFILVYLYLYKYKVNYDYTIFIFLLYYGCYYDGRALR